MDRDGIDMVAAQARVEVYADTIGVEPPKRLLGDDWAPHPELLWFCIRYGASLDWIFLGDVRGMIRDSYARAQRAHG